MNKDLLMEWATNGFEVEISPIAPKSLLTIKKEAGDHFQVNSINELGRGAACACFRHKYTNYGEIIKILNTKTARLKSKRYGSQTREKKFGKNRKLTTKRITVYAPVNVPIIRSEVFYIIRKRFDDAIRIYFNQLPCQLLTKAK